MCSSCIAWPFLPGQAITAAYDGHAKGSTCKEALAEVSFHWTCHVDIYSLDQCFQVKEDCKICCLNLSFLPF